MNKKARWLSFESNGQLGIPFKYIDTSTGTIHLEENTINQDVIIKRSYHRNSGKSKITTQINLPVKNKVIDLDISGYLKSYDIIFAIDTNTKEIAGSTITAGAVVYGQPWPKNNIKCIGYSTMMAYYFKNLKITPFKPERFVWYSFIKGLSSLKSINKFKVAIIVDSDLDLLPSINARETPIWSDFYLPPFASFMYASSDKKNDSVQNKMIHEADKQACEAMYDAPQSNFKSRIADHATILIDKDYHARQTEQPSEQIYIPISLNFLTL